MLILMSAENPGGAKLEDHLLDLVCEIEAKCEKITSDTRPAARTVLQNNREIIHCLKQAAMFQQHSMTVLRNAVGPDQGPTGTPRIGKGSPGMIGG